MKENTKAGSRLALFVGSACLLIGLSGCSSGAESMDEPGANVPPVDSTQPSEAAQVGSVSLGLDLGGATIHGVNYSIIGTGFQTSGVLDVSHSTRVAGTIGGIPFGSNYVVTLTAQSLDGPNTTCSGSATFNVTSAAPEAVAVPVSCKQQKAIAATPAPLPGPASFGFGLALLGIGLAYQKRTRKQR